MLVLSRKEKEFFFFPNLGISIQILRIAGNKVNIGVTAPTNVKIVRSELAITSHPASDTLRQSNSFSHRVRNELQKAQLAFSLAQAQLQMGKTEEAEKSLAIGLASLQDVEPIVASFTRENHSAHAVPNFGKRRRVLLVEDNSQERELLADYLRLHDYEVDIAEDCDSALAYFESDYRPDVVLLDFNLPGKNGRQTADLIRMKSPCEHTRMIFVSGSKPDRDYSQFTGTKEQWFAKPINPRRFVDELNQTVSRIGTTA